MADTREIDLLAELLDGSLDAAEAPAELGRLLQLADAVRTSVPLVPPTPAFRDALREQVLTDVASSVASGAAGTTGASAATTAVTAVTPLQTIAAAIAAATVLAGAGVVGLAPGSAPGDALYGVERAIESAQLAVGGVERDARLLLELTTERVEEALGLADPALVLDLLDESERHLDDALALLGDLDPAEARQLLEEAVSARAAALDTLVATTTDLTVGVRADQLRDATRALLPGAPAGGQGSEPAVAPDEVDDGTTDAPTTPSDAVDGQGDDPLDTVDDGVDEVEDVVDDVTDGVDDAVDDTVDDVTDSVDDVVDQLPDITDAPTDVGEDLLGP